MTTTTALTIDNLMDTLIDDRHQGFGFAGIRAYSFATQMRAADAVVTAANGLGWNHEDLFVWSNSKDARWFSDAVSYDSDDFGPLAEQFIR